MLLGALALHPRARGAYRDRSPYAFYLLAAALLFVCSLGPKPTFLGEQFLYEAPYGWLMHLPVFAGGLRVPARFAMPAVLALSAAGSLAFNRVSNPRMRRIVGLAAAAGIIGDAWLRGLPLPAVPDMWPPARAAGYAAVAELPVGDPSVDAAAMYRATVHGRPVVNAISGYEPPHYRILRLALADRDPTALDPLTALGPLLLVAEKRAAPEWAAFARADLRAEPAGENDRWAFFKLPPRERPGRAGTCGEPLDLVAARDDRGQAIDVRSLTDNDPSTLWMTAHAQRAGDALVLDLGRTARPCAVEVSLGAAAELYPRALSVHTSVDGVRWTPGFAGRLGGAAIRAALERPRDIRIQVPLPPESAIDPGQPGPGQLAREPDRPGRGACRYIKLRLEESQPIYPWIVTDLRVLGARG
jgi:hypothetical protein